MATRTSGTAAALRRSRRAAAAATGGTDAATLNDGDSNKKRHKTGSKNDALTTAAEEADELAAQRMEALMWKTAAQKTILDRSPWLVVQEHSVKLPSGKLIPDWTWIQTPEFVNVAACIPGDGDGGSGSSAASGEDQWLVFRQTKYAVGRSLNATSLAPVGGIVESGEDPLETAKRELREEAGVVSDEWVHLSSAVPDANRGCGIGHLFLAANCTAVSSGKELAADGGDLEDQHLLTLSESHVEKALLKGEFRTHSWAACMSLALMHRRRQHQQQHQSR